MGGGYKNALVNNSHQESYSDYKDEKKMVHKIIYWMEGEYF